MTTQKTAPFVYQTTFTKRDGRSRQIRYITFDDLHPDFIGQQIKGTGSKKTGPRSSLVWDVESQAFRTVNLDTITETPVLYGQAALYEQGGDLQYTWQPLQANSGPPDEPPCNN